MTTGSGSCCTNLHDTQLATIPADECAYGLPVLHRSRLLFTSRSKAAEGLRLQSITDHHVDTLSQAAATRVLLADGVHLHQDQLEGALNFCAGLPLALVLLHGALHGALRARGSFESVLERLQDSGNISCDALDKLWQALRFSVTCLSEELQIAWFDLVQLFATGSAARRDTSLQSTRDKLGALFGEQILQELQQRNLVEVKGVHHVKVVVHDVLLCMANHMCGPDSNQYHAQGDLFKPRVYWQPPNFEVGVRTNQKYAPTWSCRKHLVQLLLRLAI